MATFNMVPTGYLSQSGLWSGTDPANLTDGSDSTLLTTTGVDAAGWVTYDLTNTPSDFLSMNSITFTVRSDTQNQSGDDSWILYVRLFEADGTWITGAAEVVGGSFHSLSSRTVLFDTFTVGLTKADWDSAYLQVLVSRTQNMGADGNRIRVYEVTGVADYVAAGPTMVGLSAEAVSTSSITLHWPAVSGVTDYALERSLDGSTGWTRINGAAPQTGTSYTDTSRAMETPYYYRLRGTDSSGTGEYTSTTTASIRWPFTEDFSSWRSTHWSHAYVTPAPSIVGGALTWKAGGTGSQDQRYYPHLPATASHQTVQARFRYTGTDTVGGGHIGFFLSSRHNYSARSWSWDSPDSGLWVQLNIGSGADSFIGFLRGSSGTNGVNYASPYFSGMNNPPPFSKLVSGTWYQVKVELSRAASSTLRLKIWEDGSAEPSLWSHSHTSSVWNVPAGYPFLEMRTSRSTNDDSTWHVDSVAFNMDGLATGGASLSGSGTLSAVGEQTWPIVGYSPSATATAYSNQRGVARTSNGVVWAFFHPGGSTTMACEPRYSTDGGVTWNPGDIAYNGSGSFTENYGRNLSVFIDQDDYAHLVFKDNGNGYIYYRRGTPNAGRTAWTWSAATTIFTGTAYDYPDVVAHREGTGWVAHVVASYPDTFSSAVGYWKVSITSGAVITVGSKTDLASSSGNSNHKWPSIDFHHTGDGKTVAGGTPHLYVAWSAGATGAGKGIRFKKATYSGGSWTWGAEREIDSSLYLVYATTHWLNCAFDGTRVVITGYLDSDINGTNGSLRIYERDTTDTTTTTHSLYSGLAWSANAMQSGSSAYDAQGNIHFIGRSSEFEAEKLVSRKWVRATTTLDGVQTVDRTVNGNPFVSAKRGYAGNKIEYVYTDGAASPYTVRYGNIPLGASGSVDLSGSGSLGFSGKPAVPGSGSLSGSGTLATASAPKPIQAVQLSGSGSLTPVRGTVGVARSGVLSGSGTLTRSWVATPIQTVQLSGAGTLVATGNQQEFGTAATSGSGTLTVTRGPFVLIQTRTLSGSGTLSLVRGPMAVLSKTATLSGSGSLTFVRVVGFARSGALSGVGVLSLAGSAGFSRSGVLSGTGTLALVKWFLFQANAYGGAATGTDWVNPGNAAGVDNGSYATWTVAEADTVSPPLVVSDFGTWSSIPADATIPKITVRVKGYLSHE